MISPSKVGTNLFSDQYVRRIRSLFGKDLVSVWSLDDPAGNVLLDSSGRFHHGVGTNIIRSTSGGPNKRPASFFSSSGSFGNVFSSGLAVDFNSAEGTLSVWLKPRNVGVWSDGIARYFAEFNTDNSNRISILRSTTNNTITCAYRGGNVLKQVNIGGLSSVDWTLITFTWSVSKDRVRAYVNGVQSGADVTSLTPYAGSLAVALVGAQTAAPLSVWDGWESYVVLAKREASASEVKDMMIPP